MERNLLILRLFFAIFLVLLGGTIILFNEASVVRTVGAAFAASGLTALYLFRLGNKLQ